MTDEQIVKAITLQLTVAVVLKLIGREAVAQLFANHGLRLIAAHYEACERWMKAHKIKRLDSQPLGKALQTNR